MINRGRVLKKQRRHGCSRPFSCQQFLSLLVFGYFNVSFFILTRLFFLAK
jgi:hypothetical protein